MKVFLVQNLRSGQQ